MTTTYTTPITLAPALPPTIAGAGNYTSGVVPANGSPGLVAACTLSQAGTLAITRYLDNAGTILLDTTQVVLVAAAGGVAKVVDNTPYKSFRVTIANTAGVTGNLSNVAVLAG